MAPTQSKGDFMKAFFSILVVMMSLSISSYALDQDSSWEEIQGNSEYIIAFPSFGVSNGRFISMDNFCFDGERLYSEKHSDWAPMETKVCTKRNPRRAGECLKWEVHQRQLIHLVDVFKKLSMGKNDRRFAFEKSYAIPNCDM